MSLFPAKNMNPAGIFGGLIGILLIWYCSAIVFVPATLILLLAALFIKRRPALDERLHAISAIHLGHAIWTLAGMVAVMRSPPLNIMDSAVLALSALFLQLRSSILLIFILIAYQGTAAVYTIDLLYSLEVGSGLHRGHVLHLSLRILSLLLLIRQALAKPGEQREN